MKQTRTPRVVLEELIETAEDRHTMFTFGFSDRELERKSELVGKLVLGLSESDREILKDITSDDIEAIGFTNVFRKRPQKPGGRVRGPIKLKTK